jgi:hypothetical protein
MLKISIVLVTTAAFAALLIAYPFSPHPAAQAGAGAPQLATAAIPEEQRPSSLQPDAPVQAAAGLGAATTPAGAEILKTHPRHARTDWTPDPRIPPRPSHQEPLRFKQVAVPVTNTARTEIVTRPALARSEIPAASTTRYPAYPSRMSAYAVRRTSAGRRPYLPSVPARSAHPTERTRSLALAADQPVR